MHSSSGRSVIAYNGEIYNTDELREQLEFAGIRFHGRSDTEVLLEGCEYWGVEAMVDRCIGMFAFTFWDYKQRRLTLVRDRIGEKPLYYGYQDNNFIFSYFLESGNTLQRQQVVF